MKHKGTQDDVRSLAEMADIQEILSFFDEGGAALNALSLGGVVASDYATKTYVSESIANLVGAAPEALDTLYEISEVLQENVAEIDTILTQIGTKASQDDLDDAVARIVELENNPSLGYDSIIDALGYTPLDANDFTKVNIKSTLGISNWALASSKPSYAFSDLTSHPTTLSGYGITDALTKTGNAASATKLSDNTEYTVWGRPFFKNGKPVNVTSSPIYSRNGGFYAYDYNDESTMIMWYMSDSAKSEFILGHKSSEKSQRTRICGYPICFHIGKYTNANSVPLTPAMLIDESGDVTIEGNLIVKGTIGAGGKAIEGQTSIVGPLALSASIATGTKTQTQMDAIGFTTTAIANMEAGIYTKVVHNGLVWDYSVKRLSSTNKVIYLRNDAGTSYTISLSGTTWTIS